MGKKIAVSKTGKDVLTATNPNDFIFNSDFNTFKIVASGKVTVTPIAGSTNSVVVNHNLGTRNGFILFWQNDNESVYFQDQTAAGFFIDGGGTVRSSNNDSVTGHNNETDLTIDYFSKLGLTNAIVRYYIFEVPN